MAGTREIVSTEKIVSTRGWCGAKNIFSPKIGWIHREGPTTVWNVAFILKLDSTHRPQRPKRAIIANIRLVGQPGAKQAKKYYFFRIRSNSIRHAPRGVEGHTGRTLRCGVSELAELNILTNF